MERERRARRGADGDLAATGASSPRLRQTSGRTVARARTAAALGGSAAGAAAAGSRQVAAAGRSATDGSATLPPATEPFSASYRATQRHTTPGRQDKGCAAALASPVWVAPARDRSRVERAAGQRGAGGRDVAGDG